MSLTTRGWMGFSVLMLLTGWLIADRQAGEGFQRQADRIERCLGGFALAREPERALRQAVRAYFKIFTPEVETRPALEARRRDWLHRYPTAMRERWRFDGRGHLIAAPRGSTLQDRLDAERLFADLGRDYLEIPRADDETGRAIARFLRGGDGSRLVGRQETLVRLGNAPNRTFGAWKRGPSGGVLLFFHASVATPERLEDETRRWLQRRAIAPSLVTTSGRLVSGNPDLPPALLRELSERFFLAPRSRLRMGGATLITAGAGPGRIALARLPRPIPVLPRWALALAVLGAAMALRSATMGSNREFPVSLLLTWVLALAAGVPLAITLGFWAAFAENRERTLLDEELRDLESIAIALDDSFPGYLRKRSLMHKDWVRRLGSGVPLESMLAESYREELAGIIDTRQLISSGGVLIGHYSTSSSLLRRLLLLPKAAGRRMLASFIERGFHFFPAEWEGLLQIEREGITRDRLLRFAPYETAGLNSLVIQLAKEAIARNEQESGRESQPAREQMSSMVMDSLMGEDEGNSYRLTSALLGEFLPLRRDQWMSTGWPDLVCDSAGRAQYFVLFHCHQQAHEFSFWREIFRRRDRWPPGVSFHAPSWFELNIPFPSVMEHRRWPSLQAFLQPPRRIAAGRDHRTGRLVAALACRNMPNVVAVVTRAPDAINARLEGLRQRLAATGVIIALFVLALFARLRRTLVEPAHALLTGIEAMEAGRLNERLRLSTGDEFEDLAATFNETLAGMQEREIASVVQRRLLPAGPLQEGSFRFVGQNVMASQVGGDYYDAEPLPDGSLIFTIGDVSGHGVSAALVTAMARSAVHALLRRGVTGPAAILGELNRRFYEQLRRAKMMTMLIGRVFPDGRLELANAGHPFPWLVHRDGSVEEVQMSSTPLGIRLKASYQTVERVLSPGGFLVMFSDGLPEASNAVGEVFGYPRFGHTVVELARQSPSRGEEFVAGLQSELARFAGGVPFADDVTVAVLQRLHPGRDGGGRS